VRRSRIAPLHTRYLVKPSRVLASSNDTVSVCRAHLLLRRLLLQADFLDSQERILSREIKGRLTAEEREAVRLWDTIPGVDQTTAWVLVAEVGTNGAAIQTVCGERRKNRGRSSMR